MRNRGWLVLGFLGLVLILASFPSAAFTTVPIFNNGTDLPDDDLADAGRWSDVSGSLASDNVRGLGGGLEYAVELSFYDMMLPSFVDQNRPSREQLAQAIQSAFNRWASGSPLNFVEIRSGIFAIRDATSPGSGAEIDIFAVSGNSIDFLGNTLSGNTLQQYTSSDPRGTNGSTIPGRTLTSADILINKDRMYYMNPNDPEVQRLQAEGQVLVHFESLILHEIGHAIGLDHPDIWWNRNFDNDQNGNNSMNINCNSPSQGLQVSTNFDRNAVMTAAGSHLYRLNLTGDDLGGRNFLYPSCSGGSTAPPPAPPPADPPPPSPPPSSTPPPSPPAGSGLQAYDSNSSCVLEESEFFNLVDAWISNSVDNGMFFDGVDAWIGQENICAVASSIADLFEMKWVSSGILSINAASNRMSLTAVEIYTLDGTRVSSHSVYGQSLTRNMQEISGRTVANGIYLVLVRVFDEETGKSISQIKRVALLR